MHRSMRFDAFGLVLALLATPLHAGGGSDPTVLRYVDLDGDGRVDRLLREAGGGLVVDLNQGSHFRAVQQGLPAVAGLRDVLVSDLDGDCRLDLYLVGTGPNVALLGDGRGGFRDATQALGLGDEGCGISAERLDVDGDGDEELLLHDVEGDVLFWCRGAIFERDPVAPEPQTAQQPGELVTLLAALAEGRFDPQRLGGQALVFTPAPGGGLSLGLVGLDGHGSPSGPPAGPSFTLAQLKDLFVDDGLGEVGPEDIVDGSLTGPDVSTSEGDATFTNGHVGIGTSTPARPLHVVGAGEDAVMRLGRGEDPWSYVELEDLTSNTMKLNKYCLTGGAQQDFSPVPLDGSGLATVRFFRNTDTIGDVRLQLHPGDGTSSVDTQLGVNGVKSFLRDSYLGLGTTGPLARLHVASGGATFDVRDGGMHGNVLVVSSPSVAEQGGLILTQYVDYPAGKEGWKAYTASSGTPGSSRLSIGTIATHAPDVVTEVLTLRGSKRVGINTTSPQATLDVAGTTRTQVLSITGGADIVEGFHSAVGPLEPGTLVSVVQDGTGRIRPTRHALDRAVIGVVSGAGGVRPGLHLGQAGVAEGAVPIALSGRIHVRCSDEGGAIEPGDRLVAGSVPGVARRVRNGELADGAVIGKALSRLDAGEGLVFVLVNLQ